MLAAANAVYVTPGVALAPIAVAEAEEYAELNLGIEPTRWASCTDPAKLPYHVPGNQCVSFDSLVQPTEIRVRIPDVEVQTRFAAAFGISEVDVSAAAQAAIDGDGLAQCGFCVLGDMDHDLQNGDIAMTGGATIAFNGSVCVRTSGQVSVEAPGVVAIEGDARSDSGCKDTVTQFPDGRTENAGPIADPLSFLPLPPAAATGLTTKGASTNACSPVNGGPGIYGSLNIPNNSLCVLTPGLYVVTGQNHISGGSTVVNAFGATLYFTCGTRTAPRACNAGESGGDLLMTGSAALNHTAPKCVLPEVVIPGCASIKGLSIVADRNNAASFGWRGNGAVLPSSGTIYLASGTLDYRGNGGLQAIDSLIVVRDLTNSGNTELKAKYSRNVNVEIPGGALHLTK